LPKYAVYAFLCGATILICTIQTPVYTVPMTKIRKKADNRAVTVFKILFLVWLVGFVIALINRIYMILKNP